MGVVRDIDGNEYDTVQVGDQLWTVQNLKVGRFNNGDEISEVTSIEKWEYAGINGIPAWCFYLNNSEMEPIHGRLYNWHAVTDPRGLAVDGWTIPSLEDWNRLEQHVGKENAGKKLKSVNGWQEIKSKDRSGFGVPANGVDSFGFTGLPSGFRDDHKNRMNDRGEFCSIGESAAFWTRSFWRSEDMPDAWMRQLFSGYDSLSAPHGQKGMGLSVRCCATI